MKKFAILQPLGLDKKAEIIYRALLGLADAPAVQVAHIAGVKRTSVYHVLENLIAMGLASSYQERGVRRFVAEHPAKLKTFFERQAILAERFIPELEKELSKFKGKTSVRVFEGKEAIKSMNEKALASKEKTILSIGSSKKLLEFLGGKYGWGKRRREYGIFQRSLRFPEDQTIDSPSRFHNVRLLPEFFKFPGYIIIFDTSVEIIPFGKPDRGYLINDPGFSQMARSIFQALWESAAVPHQDA